MSEKLPLTERRLAGAGPARPLARELPTYWRRAPADESLGRSIPSWRGRSRAATQGSVRLHSSSLGLTLMLLALLAGAAFGLRALVRLEHQTLVAQLEDAFHQHLVEAAGEVSDGLDDQSDVLRLAGELMASGGQPQEHERELRAVLEAVAQVRAIASYGSDGSLQLYLLARRAQPALQDLPYRQAMQDQARRALAQNGGEVVVSPSVAGGTGPWHRVMARRFGDGPDRGAVAILVDTEPIFAPLRVLRSGAGSALAVLGPNENLAESSSSQLRDALRDAERSGHEQSALAPLIAAIHHSETGERILEPEVSSQLGLGREEAMVAFLPVPMKDGPAWMVAAFESLAPVRAHEGRLQIRLALAVLALLLILGALAGYGVVARGRALALRASQQQAERLAEDNLRIEQILDNIPAGVVALAPTLQVLAVNRPLRERLPSAVPGATLDQAFPDAAAEVRAELARLVRAALDSGHPQNLVSSMRLFQGEGHFAVRAVPVRSADREVRALLVVEDLSDVRALQSQLIRSEKLATLGVLAAGIAHEVGTPLGVVRGRAEYIQGKLGPDHPQREGLQVIVDQIDRVSRTVRQLLDFARMEPAPTQPTELEPVLQAVYSLLRVEAERRKLTLSLELCRGLPRILANPDQLQQVLVNLVINACDASAPGGRIVLGAGPTASGLASSTVHLWVRDSGVGIPEASLHQIFDPFFTTKKRGEGTGLGMTIVADIVGKSGGRIEIESEPGQGTCVSVHWPVAPSSSEAVHAQS